MPATTAIRKRRQAYRQAVEVDVSAIRYTQATVKDSFSNGAPLLWTIHMLKTKQIKPREIPLIRIGCVDNHWRTIDNRRLYCFKASGIDKIPTIIMQDIKEEFTYKNTSENDGLSIELVHHPPINIDHNQMIMAYDPETSECKRWKIATVIQRTIALGLIQPTVNTVPDCVIKNNIKQRKNIILAQQTQLHAMCYPQFVYNQSHIYHNGNHYGQLSHNANIHNVRRYANNSTMEMINNEENMKHRKEIDDRKHSKYVGNDDMKTKQMLHVSNEKNNFVKTHVFSVLDQLQHIYTNQQDTFFGVLEEYMKQHKK